MIGQRFFMLVVVISVNYIGFQNAEGCGLHRVNIFQRHVGKHLKFLRLTRTQIICLHRIDLQTVSVLIDRLNGHAVGLHFVVDILHDDLKSRCRPHRAFGNGKLTKGQDVEFEAAADRRAVSLAAAAGYDADALLSVLSRIKADNGGFGEAYPVNRDELVKQFKESYKVAAPAVAVGDYQAVRTQVEKITAADLFIKNK